MRNVIFRDVALLIFTGLLMLLIVNPVGNFPLNDDWVYSRTVSYLVNNGFYYSPDYYTAIFAAQAIWGALFCLPFGFSFTALRISVFVLGLLAVIIFYILVNTFSGNRKLSLLCAMLLLVNPLFFSLSNTFMTDIPFLSFALFAIFFFSKAINSPGLKYILPAIAFSVIATLVRQIGAIIPIAYGLIQILKNKPSLSKWVSYFLPAVITLLALQCTLILVKRTGSETPAFEGGSILSFLSKPLTIAGHIFVRTSCFLYYCSVFFFPVLLFTGIDSFKRLSSGQKTRVGIFIVLCIPFLVYGWMRFPYGNILNHNYYIGPKTLSDVRHLQLHNAPFLSPLLRYFISAIGLSGSVLLLVNIACIVFNRLKREKTDTRPSLFQQNFFWLCLAGYSALICIPLTFFDRYFLFIMAIIILSIVSQALKDRPLNKVMVNFSAGYVIVMALFSSLATHDYMQWNRSRWEALTYLTKELKIPPLRIDGGWEFNGWSGAVVKSTKDTGWTCITDDEYIISFGDVPNYNTIKKYLYTNYFPYEQKEICIVHRK
jgi:4-amino-4-deoxy-L-arabinose transferase-like glycosyltransferase